MILGIKVIQQGDDYIGNRTRVKVVKNKVAPPFKVIEFDIMYGQGISKSGVILDSAVDEDIVEKAGSWYSYNGEKLGQGRENVKTYLEENEDILHEIEEKLRENINSDKKDSKESENVEEDSENEEE